MLQVKGLTITMRKDLRVLLRDLDFALNPGDKVAIIGEEGDGKSTLLKLLFHETLVESYADWEGSIAKKGMILGYLAQEVSPQEGALSVYEYCCAQPGFLEANPAGLAAAEAPVGVSLEDFYAQRLVSSLSGGEKVKLRMALLGLRQPDAYLLDEPSNDLDVETLEWLEDFIIRCPQPVLFISHDEVLLEKTANAVLHLEQLRRKTLPRWTLARMGYRQYVEERLQRFGRQEQAAKKEREEDRKRQEKLRQFEKKEQHQLDAISRANPAGGRLLKKKMKSVKSMEHRFNREREDMTEFPDTEEAITVDFSQTAALPWGKPVLDLSLSALAAPDGALLAKNVELHLRGPEHICITGKNGAGKTTLLRRIAQELLPRADLKAAYMPQDYSEAVDQSLTPVEFLAPGGQKVQITQAKTYLGSMKYTPEECAHSISGLSGGQKAKLFLLKMILDGSNVLLLDEPTRNFSPLSGPVIRAMLRDFRGCVISVSHDRKFISEAGGQLYRLGPQGLENG